MKATTDHKMKLRKGLWRGKTLFLKTIKEIKCVLLHHRRSNDPPHKLPKPHIFNLPCCRHYQHENEMHRPCISSSSSSSDKEQPVKEDIVALGIEKKPERELAVKKLERSFGSCRSSVGIDVVVDYNGAMTTKKKKMKSSNDDNNARGRMLVQKMKQLEMIDLNDEDGVFDIQQVIGYYSCLKSPVYVEMVDRFFVDMYSEFFLRQPSIGVATNNYSSRRLGPIKI